MSVSLAELQAGFQHLAAPKEGSPPVGNASTPLPAAAAPSELVEHARKGYHLAVRLEPGQILGAAVFLDGNGFAIDTITGVDWLEAGEMEVVYDFFHLTEPVHVAVSTRVPRENPELPTICRVYPGANWHERETHDFFGIRFLGHPDLSPLLLPEDASYHPLRKDFNGET